MLWFQKDSLDTVGFRTYGGGSRVLNQKVTFEVLNVPKSPKKCQFVFDGTPETSLMVVTVRWSATNISALWQLEVTD